MELDRLFGSRVRAATLLALSATPRPQSAYRLAKAAEAQPIQVLKILNELSPTVERGPEGWVLRDDLMRSFLRAQVSAGDRELRDEKDELLIRLGLRPSRSDERG